MAELHEAALIQHIPYLNRLTENRKSLEISSPWKLRIPAKLEPNPWKTQIPRNYESLLLQPLDAERSYRAAEMLEEQGDQKVRRTDRPKG